MRIAAQTNTAISMILEGNDAKNIMDVAKLIQDGQVAAFPTETVYGLGADAYNEEALRKIFKTNNRKVMTLKVR